MRSKLLQAVGLGPRWRPPTDEPPEEEPAPGGPRVGRRQRRPPAALQQPAPGSQDSGSGGRPAGSRPGQSSRSQGSGSEGSRKRARAHGATSAKHDTPPPPPMVVLVVDDPQRRVPAWPGVMQLPASLAAGGMPFVQGADGGWQLPAGDALIQQVQQSQQVQQALLQVRQAQHQAWAQQQAQQQALRIRQAQQVQHPALRMQHAQRAQQHTLQLARPPTPLAIEDVLFPQLPSMEDAAQHAGWEVLSASGLLPPLAVEHPAAHAAQPAPAAPVPAAVSRTVTTGATVPAPWAEALPAQQAQQQAQQQALAWRRGPQQPVAPLSVNLSASRSAGTLSGRSSNPAASPFAAESALEIPREEQSPLLSSAALRAPGSPALAAPPPQHVGAGSWEPGPLASLQPADFSLLGLSASGLDGLRGASLASLSTTISNDLHLLFAAWEQGLVSLSLSRRNLSGPPPAEQ